MGWFGKLTFGSLGFFFGGPLGAVVGGALGHHLVDKQQRRIAEQQAGGLGGRPGRAEQVQAAYFVSIFSILGKLAKADGVVTQEELAVVNTFIDGMNIDDGEKQFARQVFTEAKNSSYAIEDFARQFYEINQNQPQLLASFLDVLFRVAAADGQLHPAEEEALLRVKAVFSINEQQYEEIRAVYFKDADKYYKVLNCTPQSSTDDIKKSYRELVRDFHPDTIVAKGLPEEFTEFATKRFREIQEAYEAIRQERGF